MSCELSQLTSEMDGTERTKYPKSDSLNLFSCLVAITEQISKHFIEDLERLAALNLEVEAL